jgi:carbonic anhydrase
MKDLLAGYRRFRRHGWPRRRKAFETLAAKGQSPRALILGCVDSRVDPATIFDAAPGELLIVRNVANLVPPYAPDSAYHGTSAALEFGVRVLGVRHIIVLGHGLCGGVKALLEGAPTEAREFVEPWMSIARAARDLALACPPPQRQRCCEHEVIRLSLANLMTFPWIAERASAGLLDLHGAWFEIASGQLLLLQPDGRFAPPDHSAGF